MKLDEFIRDEAKRRAPYARASPQWVETELIAAMKAVGVELIRLAREDAEAHRGRAAGRGATFALQEFADGVSLSVNKLPREILVSGPQ